MTMEEVENWRPVVGFEGSYEVSDLGNVRSVTRTLSNGKVRKGQMMSQRPEKRGTGKQMNVILTTPEGVKKKSVKVHILVMEAFGRPRENREQVRHIDGDTSNNKFGNLKWVVECPQGHPYEGHNILPSYIQRSRKVCRACHYASRFINENEDLVIPKQFVADRFFEGMSSRGVIAAWEAEGN